MLNSSIGKWSGSKFPLMALKREFSIVSKIPTRVCTKAGGQKCMKKNDKEFVAVRELRN